MVQWPSIHHGLTEASRDTFWLLFQCLTDVKIEEHFMRQLAEYRPIVYGYLSSPPNTPSTSLTDKKRRHRSTCHFESVVRRSRISSSGVLDATSHRGAVIQVDTPYEHTDIVVPLYLVRTRQRTTNPANKAFDSVFVRRHRLQETRPYAGTTSPYREPWAN